jgi:N6-adenosine-specific RNA methylase IME4
MSTCADRKAKVVMKKARREQRERDLATKILALPTKRYGAILADAGWRFEPWSRETGMDRAAENHYVTSSVETIAAIDVASIAAADCVLFLWATSPMMPQALEVMQAWDFTYKTQTIWDKEIRGTGYWFINQHEILLLGTRGKVPAPVMGTQWPSIVRERKRGHSVKPEWAYRMIEGYFPNIPKIELFARAARDGWDCWGLEAPTMEAAE